MKNFDYIYKIKIFKKYVFANNLAIKSLYKYKYQCKKNVF